MADGAAGKRSGRAKGDAGGAETKGDGRQTRLRSLAAVDEVLRDPAAQELLERYPRALVTDAVRAVIERLRAEILTDAVRPARRPPPGRRT